MNLEALELRRAKLRLDKRELAHLAGRDEMTVGRILRGDEKCQLSTLRAIDDALRSEEWRLKAYLDRLLEGCERPHVEAAE